MAMQDPSAAIEASLSRANSLFVSGTGSTLEILKEADELLSKKLERVAKKNGGADATYTEAHAQVYRDQIRLVTEYLKQRMLGKTHEQAREAVSVAVKQTVATATMLEERYAGVTRPLSLHSQSVQDAVINKTNASLIRVHESSWNRYGEALTKDFERVMRVGQLTGMSHHEMISRLVKSGELGGINAQRLHAKDPAYFPEPTGYLERRYWAERIVRTEIANAYNAASLNTIEEFKNRDFPDLQKKILAHFDARTAADSRAVHGQIRPLDGYFMDGAGRQYLRPPGRPHDRETIIPWRPHWDEVEATEPPKPKEIVEAKDEAAPSLPQTKQPTSSVAPIAIQAIRKARLAAIIASQEEQAKQQVAAKAFAEQSALESIAAAKAETATRVELLKSEIKKAKSELEQAKRAAVSERRFPYEITQKQAIYRGKKLRSTSKPGERLGWVSSLEGKTRIADLDYQETMWSHSHGKMTQADVDAAHDFSDGYDWLIREYKGGRSFSSLVSAELRHRKERGFLPIRSLAIEKVNRAIKDAKIIDEMFEKTLDSPVKIVYRGLGGLSSSQLNQILGNDFFDMQQKPSSTSADPEVAHSFAHGTMLRRNGHGVVLKLHRKVSKGIGINKVSEYPEQEVLIRGNAQFKVISRHRANDFEGREVWEIEAEEI